MEKTVVLKNKLSQLSRLSLELENLGNEWNIKPEIILTLGLVLEELFVIYHSGMPEQKSDFDIEIHFTDLQTHIKTDIITNGKKFNPLSESIQTNKKLIKLAGDRETGSLGIDFVVQNVNSAVYQRKKQTNTLTLTNNY